MTQEKCDNMHARVEFLDEKLREIMLQADLQFQERKYQKIEEGRLQFDDTCGVKSAAAGSMW